jgi:hypothetical protein
MQNVCASNSCNRGGDRPKWGIMPKQAPVTAQGPDYIPALSFDALTPFYDSVLRWVMQEERFKWALLQWATIQDR